MNTFATTGESGRIWTRRRVVAGVLLLVAVGVVVTPVQWYAAYVRLRRAERRGPRARREGTWRGRTAGGASV
jgi:hypothetical protein